MIHPATLISEPNRDPDHMEYSKEVWFEEMVYSWKQSNGEFQTCPMMVCPLTGMLMYMMHTYPLAWQAITDEDVKESYMRFLVEKELLGKYETLG